MTTMTEMKRNDERGNALFLILIAVALFAALSYAVTQSGRGGGTVDKEQALISASQITQYPAALRTATTRMVITGTAITALDFSGTTLDTEVFSATGGGAVAQDPPANTTSPTTAWAYLDATHATDGWFITGIGTSDAATAGREVIAALNNVTDNVCQSINRGLGLQVAPRVEAATISLTVPGAGTGAGANAYSFDIWGNTTGVNDPQPFACVENGNGANIYYHALVEQ